MTEVKEEATSSRRAPTLWNEARACSSSRKERGRRMEAQGFWAGGVRGRARAGCAVVPVTIRNTGYLMPVGDEFYAGGRLRRGDVTMVVHAPLYADPYKCGPRCRFAREGARRRSHRGSDVRSLARALRRCTFGCYVQGGRTPAQARADGVPIVPLNVSESISR